MIRLIFVGRSESTALANLFMDALGSIPNFAFSSALAGLKMGRIDETKEYAASSGSNTQIALSVTPLFVFVRNVDDAWVELLPGQAEYVINTSSASYRGYLRIELSIASKLNIHAYSQNGNTGSYYDTITGTIHIIYLYT